MEIQACRDKMYRFETEEESKCIREHPGFNEIVLNEWVLEHAALGLKTKGHKSYASVFQTRTKDQSRVSFGLMFFHYNFHEKILFVC